LLKKTIISPLSVDCREWAVRAKRALRRDGVRNVEILYMKSLMGRNASLGPYRLIDGTWYTPQAGQRWFHHYAVVVGNHVRDECYPHGLNLYEYMRTVFEYYDMVSFTIMPFATGHR
jgi:hypothetical protein